MSIEETCSYLTQLADIKKNYAIWTYQRISPACKGTSVAFLLISNSFATIALLNPNFQPLVKKLYSEENSTKIQE